jgi:hypothetical protein
MLTEPGTDGFGFTRLAPALDKSFSCRSATFERDEEVCWNVTGGLALVLRNVGEVFGTGAFTTAVRLCVGSDRLVGLYLLAESVGNPVLLEVLGSGDNRCRAPLAILKSFFIGSALTGILEKVVCCGKIGEAGALPGDAVELADSISPGNAPGIVDASLCALWCVGCASPESDWLRLLLNITLGSCMFCSIASTDALGIPNPALSAVVVVSNTSPNKGLRLL